MTCSLARRHHRFGGNGSLRNLIHIYQTTRRHIPEDRDLTTPQRGTCVAGHGDIHVRVLDEMQIPCALAIRIEDTAVLPAAVDVHQEGKRNFASSYDEYFGLKA
jgi:hypothetical protein